MSRLLSYFPCHTAFKFIWNALNGHGDREGSRRRPDTVTPSTSGQAKWLALLICHCNAIPPGSNFYAEYAPQKIIEKLAAL